MDRTQRRAVIKSLLDARGFLSLGELKTQVDASSATIRRDLEHLARIGQVKRVRGGVQSVGEEETIQSRAQFVGDRFHESAHRQSAKKAAIGKAAATLCASGEGVIIDGGSTTLQMCRHLAGLNLQVLTNSLHVVCALLPQAGTGILLPAGAVLREQNIILSGDGEDITPHFRAPKLFMGAAALGAQGLMQADPLLVGAERRLIQRADRIIVLVDSSKFLGPSGHVVCRLDEIDTVVTDDDVTDADRMMVEQAGVGLIIAS
jgi:DeoR family ulaG and ulaABCDEF operon transcriptional repressor